MYSEVLQETIRPYVLAETPAVLSIGRRCVEQGYSFIWRANQLPVLVLPDQTIVKLEVHRNIPVLRVGHRSPVPCEPTEFQMVPTAPGVIIDGEEYDTEPYVTYPWRTQTTRGACGFPTSK